VLVPFGIIIPLLIFAAWLFWLIFCAYVATKHPNRAADIVRAAGWSFPFRRFRRWK
jgi:hypothetical protein